MVNGDKIKNRGRFPASGNATHPPADTLSDKQTQPEPSEPVTQTVHSRRSFAGRAVGAIFLLIAAVCIAAVAWPVIKGVVGDLANLAMVVFSTAVLVGAHGLTTWWTLTTRPHWSQWLIVHTPYLVMYAMTYLWFFHGWSIDEGGPPSLWYLPWTGVALGALSWLIVWWLRGDRKNPQRATWLFAGLAVLLVVNGGGLLVDRWKSTDGFGMQGQPTPRDAWYAFSATSCLFKHDFYTKGGKSLPAHCPEWTKTASPELDHLMTSQQPRETLNRWYDHHRRFQYLPRLTYDPPVIEDQDDAATLRVNVIQPWRDEGQDLSGVDPTELWCLESTGRTEEWIVHLETVPLGGWKVSKIDVSNPVQIVAYVGSPCQPTTPK